MSGYEKLPVKSPVVVHLLAKMPDGSTQSVPIVISAAEQIGSTPADLWALFERRLDTACKMARNMGAVDGFGWSGLKPMGPAERAFEAAVAAGASSTELQPLLLAMAEEESGP